MFGKFKKCAATSAGVALAAGSLLFAPQAEAAPSNNSTCVVTAATATSNVENIQMGINGAGRGIGHPGQAAAPNGKMGIYYPVTDPVTAHATPRSQDGFAYQTGDKFRWSNGGTCANNGFTFLGSGTGIGYCGRSVGMGTSVVNGVTSIIEWQSVGSQLVLTHPTARGSVNAQANPPGDPGGSCLSGTAVTFKIDGVITDTTA
ncbi:MAG: hypothetical protein ACT452_01835 [Microthrixaceae bacterium]